MHGDFYCYQHIFLPTIIPPTEISVQLPSDKHFYKDLWSWILHDIDKLSYNTIPHVEDLFLIKNSVTILLQIILIVILPPTIYI